MEAAGRAQERAAPRFVYVTRFGSHRCGSVLWLGRRRSAASGEPRGADAARPLSGGERPPDPRAPQPSSTGLTQENLSKKFDFPIPLSEASKKTKKKKKDSAWKSVHKVISRMLKENEKCRLRLKCQQSSTES
ncbi:uncharacterized protein C5orf47 homolog isoform X2 [Sorex araneus]|uniref:uncharacterized protein C5orf47 homolog isoform X2 n=1 Tax=Sorex araneus TaxID=42254 RepID=UPI0003316FF2|nr:uncharacterized protein C5orf47 homolog isoform X2 [Sorex araneus]